MDIGEGEIKSIVKKILEELDSKRVKNYKKINLILKKILSPQESRHINISSFKEDTLKINTDSSVVLYQLKLKKDLLLNRLQKDFPFIKEISFSLVSFLRKTPSH